MRKRQPNYNQEPAFAQIKRATMSMIDQRGYASRPDIVCATGASPEFVSKVFSAIHSSGEATLLPTSNRHPTLYAPHRLPAKAGYWWGCSPILRKPAGQSPAATPRSGKYTGTAPTTTQPMGTARRMGTMTECGPAT